MTTSSPSERKPSRSLPHRHSSTRTLPCSDSWTGKGVTKAVENLNKVLAPALIGKNPAHQRVRPKAFPPDLGCRVGWHA